MKGSTVFIIVLVIVIVGLWLGMKNLLAYIVKQQAGKTPGSSSQKSGSLGGSVGFGFGG